MSNLKSRSLTLPKARFREAGFTFIELLIVVFIVGIISTLISLSVGNNTKDSLKLEAERMSALVQLAVDEAVFKSNTLAVEFEATGYRFLESKESEFIPIADDRLLVAHTLPEDLYMDIYIEGAKVKFGGATAKTQAPRVFIYESNEVSPFLIKIHRTGEPETYSITGDEIGNTVVKEEVPKDA